LQSAAGVAEQGGACLQHPPPTTTTIREEGGITLPFWLVRKAK